MKSYNKALIFAGLATLSSSPAHTASSSALQEFKEVLETPVPDFTTMTRGFLVGLITPGIGLIRAGNCSDKTAYQYNNLRHTGEIVPRSDYSMMTAETTQLLVNQAGVQSNVTGEKIAKLGSTYRELRRAFRETGTTRDESEHMKTCDDILGGQGLTIKAHNDLLERLTEDSNFYDGMLLGSGLSTTCLMIFLLDSYYKQEAPKSNVRVFIAEENEFHTFVKDLLRRKLNKEDLD